MIETPQMAIRGAVLRVVTGELSAAEVHAVEECGLSATEAACLDDAPLLEYDEYAAVASTEFVAPRQHVAAEKENVK